MSEKRFPENTEGKPKEEYKPGDHSEADKSKITTPEQDAKKEQKAREIIDEIVSAKLKPIYGQLAEIPNVIHKTVIDVINQLQAQAEHNAQQQNNTIGPQQPVPQQNNTAQVQKIGELVTALAPLFGKGEAPSQNNELQNMIMQSFAKMIQAKVDETIMGTYGIRVPPPVDAVKPKRSTLEFE